MGLRLSPEKTLITHIAEGLDFLGWRIQRQRRPGDDRHYVYTYPAKKALAAICRKVKAACRGTSMVVAAHPKQAPTVMLARAPSFVTVSAPARGVWPQRLASATSSGRTAPESAVVWCGKCPVGRGGATARTCRTRTGRACGHDRNEQLSGTRIVAGTWPPPMRVNGRGWLPF
jgi:hypothetical protein